MTRAQCDFADGICESQSLYRILLIIWGKQPQVFFKKGTVIGQLEEASLIEHGDPLWSNLWEESTKIVKDQSVKVCQVISDQLN